MTEKQQYMIENNPFLMDLFERLDCEVIPSENDKKNIKISARISNWFDAFSDIENIEKISRNQRQ